MEGNPWLFMISGPTLNCSDCRDLYLWSGVGGVLINFQYVNEVVTWSCDMGLRHMGGCNTCYAKGCNT